MENITNIKTYRDKKAPERSFLMCPCKPGESYLIPRVEEGDNPKIIELECVECDNVLTVKDGIVQRPE